MLRVQRRLAARILKCGQNRVRFDAGRLDDIKEAITKKDVLFLINNGVITKKRPSNTSKFWARHRKMQKSKGRQKGHGSRKGKKTARLEPKRDWINRIRLQRAFIKSLRDKEAITASMYHELYMKSKGGFFRNLRHLKLYVSERGIARK